LFSSTRASREPQAIAGVASRRVDVEQARICVPAERCRIQCSIVDQGPIAHRTRKRLLVRAHRPSSFKMMDNVLHFEAKRPSPTCRYSKLLEEYAVRILQKTGRPMIRLHPASKRHHDRRLKREVWRTFDPLDRSDHFGMLEALDESRLPPRADIPRRAGGRGEIITYVREGAVAYECPTGHAGVIQASEFQRMTIASGARHSEANASRVAWAHVFQIQLLSSSRELESRREQKRFSAAQRRGGLCIVASPDDRAGALHLGHDIWIYSALLEPGQHVVHELAFERAAWLHVVQGDIKLGDLVLTTGDGAGVTKERAVSLTDRRHSEILLFDVAERNAPGT